MIASITSRHLAIGTAGLLAVAAVWPWIAPVATATRPASPDRPAPAPPLVALPAPAMFSAIAERPLFSPTRRPSTPLAPPVSASAPTQYRLIGVMVVGASRRALVADGARRVEISEGSALDAWTVKRIESDRVLLSSPQGETVLSLQRAPQDAAPAAR